MARSFFLPSFAPSSTGDDATNYNMGLIFYSTTPGNILGARYYKVLGDDGLHTARLYNADTQELLRTKNFSSETSQGWQEVLFDTPFSAIALQRYLVAVNLANNKYPFQAGFFNSNYVNENLVAPSGANNAFDPSPNGFPSGSFGSSCYFRDVVFSSASETKLIGRLTTQPTIALRLRSQVKILGAIRTEARLQGIIKSQATSLEKLKSLKVQAKLSSRIKGETRLRATMRTTPTLLLNIRSVNRAIAKTGHITIKLSPSAKISIKYICD
jgi:hypothetical protein